VFLSALAASNWGKTSRSRRGRANSPEVWGQQKHSGDGRSWRIDDDLEVDRDTRCPTTIPVLRKCQVESELDIPFKVVADFMARAWRLVGGCRVCLNGEGGWNLPSCKEFQASSILLNDRSFFPTPNPTNLEPIVPWMHLCQIHHHVLSHGDSLVHRLLVL